MNHPIREIAEEIERLLQAWPDAPAEVWDSLYEEFAEAGNPTARRAHHRIRSSSHPSRKQVGQRGRLVPRTVT